MVESRPPAVQSHLSTSKFSLYPSSSRPTTSREASTIQIPSQSSSAATNTQSPLALPAKRSDSLLNRQSCRPQTSHNPSENQPQQRSFTAPQFQQTTPERPSEASRLRSLNNGYRHSPSQEGRSTPDSITENFSRPRQLSVRGPNEASKPAYAPRSQLDSALEEDVQGFDFGRGARGYSGDSLSSAQHSAASSLRSAVSILNYHTADSIHTRQRHLNILGYPQERDMYRSDEPYSGYQSDFIAGPINNHGEEVRTSFRSALTTGSSFPGSSDTGRSSVASNSNSVMAREEGMSVEDVVGIYQEGFTDVTMDEDRSRTADSHDMRVYQLCQAMNESVVIPKSNVTIRDSAAIFGLDGDRDDYESPDGPAWPDMQENYFDTRPGTSRPITSARPQTLEHDTTRDCYGFRKKTQSITLAQYEAWEKGYKWHVAKRRKKWVTLMQKKGLITSSPNRFPPKSDEVKRYVRKGIPPEWRGDAWFYYFGGPAILGRNPGVYDECIQKVQEGCLTPHDDEAIEKDLQRTFPDNIRFKNEYFQTPQAFERQEPETPIVMSLRRVLQAFAIHKPATGYCQSLNFLAGMLLLFMVEERAFWMLVLITDVSLPGTHAEDLEGSNVDLGVLMMSVKENMPAIYKIVDDSLLSVSSPALGMDKDKMRLPSVCLCMHQWFMAIFTNTLPYETTMRVWDMFFYDGSKTLFIIALAIFKLGESEIKSLQDSSEIFQVVQSLPRKMLDPNLLMNTAYKKFGKLTQDNIENRRKERRIGYAEQRGELVPVVVRKKSSLFGRSKTVRQAAVV
ncbi:rab-GTPase-TBC domain-containing protein [Calycina marina]|uniref:Rab-GTPase-TBC domain-containing protein n=1 Tax=Calycina marina TaxID=1763456 RepID=A0A9P7YZT7_9HELO|nr:rab-GTPase-TBC domain-containing protein [Calycina marina]